MKKMITDVVKIIISVLIADVLFVAVVTFGNVPRIDINTIQAFFETLVNTVVSAWMHLQFAYTSTMNGTVPVKTVLAVVAMAIGVYKIVDIYTTKNKKDKKTKEIKVDPV